MAAGDHGGPRPAALAAPVARAGRSCTTARSRGCGPRPGTCGCSARPRPARRRRFDAEASPRCRTRPRVRPALRHQVDRARHRVDRRRGGDAAARGAAGRRRDPRHGLGGVRLLGEPAARRLRRAGHDARDPRRRRAAHARSTASRCGWSAPRCTPGSRPSGCAPWSTSSPTGAASGRSAATTTGPTRGRTSGTPTRSEASVEDVEGDRRALGRLSPPPGDWFEHGAGAAGQLLHRRHQAGRGDQRLRLGDVLARRRRAPRPAAGPWRRRA